jgi:hypothetical protein
VNRQARQIRQEKLRKNPVIILMSFLGDLCVLGGSNIRFGNM